MLFPTDPNAKAGLWERFEERLRLDGVKFIILGGSAVPENSRDVVCKDVDGSILSRFRSADTVRIGSSRGQANGPFFALGLTDGVATVVDYAVAADEQRNSARVMEHVEALALNMFFELKDVHEIGRLPTTRTVRVSTEVCNYLYI
jgi:hypothetical protein